MHNPNDHRIRSPETGARFDLTEGRPASRASFDELFPPGVLPARMYGDQRLDATQAGAGHFLQANELPLRVAAGATGNELMSNRSAFNYTLLWWNILIVDVATGLVNSLLPVYFRLWRGTDAYRYTANDNWHAARAFMGGANFSFYFPGFLPLPLMIESGEVLEFFFRNDHAQDVDIWISTYGRRRD